MRIWMSIIIVTALLLPFAYTALSHEDDGLEVVHNIRSGLPNPGWKIHNLARCNGYKKFIEGLEPYTGDTEALEEIQLGQFLVFNFGAPCEFPRYVEVHENAIAVIIGEDKLFYNDDYGFYGFLAREEAEHAQEPQVDLIYE